MSLSAALDLARASLSASSARSAVVSRNVAGAGQAGYSRRIASLTGTGGGVSLAVTRAVDAALSAAALQAGSAAERDTALKAGYVQLEATVGDPADGTSVASKITALQTALQTYAANPTTHAAGLGAVAAAGDLARSLNGAAATVANVVAGTKADVAASVATINGLLAQYATADDAVRLATATGRDPSDAADTRDALAASLSAEVGLTVRPQRDGSAALYTDGGLTLYEHGARAIAVSDAGAVVIDGVDATSPGARQPLSSGKLAGLVALRGVAGTYGRQLDETARALVAATTPSDGGPGPFDPAGTTAATLRVAAVVDPSQGGAVEALRDGTGAASTSSTRLQALADGLDVPQGFAADAGLPTSAAPSAFASQSAAWLEAGRKAASDGATTSAAVRDRAATSLSNATGVNVDDEMAGMLEVERSYQASAKLLSVVDGLFGTLIQAVAA